MPPIITGMKNFINISLKMHMNIFAVSKENFSGQIFSFQNDYTLL